MRNITQELEVMIKRPQKHLQALKFSKNPPKYDEFVKMGFKP